MTTPACRFEVFEGNHFATCQAHAPVCVDDFSELFRADICDLGLSTLRCHLEEAQRLYAVAFADAKIARQERDEQTRVMGRLREALEVYGSHRYFCSAKPYDPCSCGLEQTLSPEPKEV